MSDMLAIGMAGWWATRPAAGDVQEGVDRGDGVAGTFGVPAEAAVQDGVQFGAGGTEFTGTYDPGGTHVVVVTDGGFQVS